MQTLIILLVFVCSVISAPIGGNSGFRSSGTDLSSPFVNEPLQARPSAPLSITGSLPVEKLPLPSLPRSWVAPSDMTDLSSFKVLGTPSGNIEIVSGAPAQVVQAGFDSLALSTWDNKSAIMQVYYPQGSINPANKIIGGANFYAAPLSLSNARNVSLEYSVFFPLDFDWVKGGKLPGLYGGHKSCSGGDSASMCFSTRLMWRGNGTGELYLYAPKDKQTKAFCSTLPQSVCESNYGLSIARGSFSFTRGAWTHLRQTVYLNTPGRQDGGFLLEVNGKSVIDRMDVYYRDVLVDPQIVAASNPKPLLTAQTKRIARLLMKRTPQLEATTSTTPESSSIYYRRDLVDFPGISKASNLQSLLMRTKRSPQLNPTVPIDSESSATSGLIGFTGLFFSTFFGGHTSSWATPKDQYSWFKDFAIYING